MTNFGSVEEEIQIYWVFRRENTYITWCNHHGVHRDASNYGLTDWYLYCSGMKKAMWLDMTWKIYFKLKARRRARNVYTRTKVYSQRVAGFAIVWTLYLEQKYILPENKGVRPNESDRKIHRELTSVSCRLRNHLRGVQTNTERL